MNADPASQRVYQNHRDNQLERILEAAEKLFIQDGIDNVSISAIAEAARLSRKTIYQYFPDKREIAWGIFQKLFEGAFADQQFLQSKGNGFQRIESFFQQMLYALETYPEQARFIVEFNTIYAREDNASRLVEIFKRVNYNNLLVQAVQDGISDGSLRPDLDPELSSAAIGNLISAVIARFSLLGDHISEEYELPWKNICLQVIQIFLRGIQSSSTS